MPTAKSAKTKNPFGDFLFYNEMWYYKSMNQKISIQNYILYILNKLEPAKSDKIRLNKLAFFVEFAYLHKFGEALTDAKYAAIDMGPVFDNYDSLLKEMEKQEMVKIDGYKIRPLTSPEVSITDEVKAFIDAVIEKYSVLSRDELIALSHQTDSYKITTDNEKKMGNVIDKKLAMLETFFDDMNGDDVELESELPIIDRSNLVEYVG